MSKNCYVETALEMSGYSKLWDTSTDLSLFLNRDCWVSSSKTGVLVLLQKNALNFIRFSICFYLDKEVCRLFAVTLFPRSFY